MKGVKLTFGGEQNGSNRHRPIHLQGSSTLWLRRTSKTGCTQDAARALRRVQICGKYYCNSFFTAPAAVLAKMKIKKYFLYHARTENSYNVMITTFDEAKHLSSYDGFNRSLNLRRDISYEKKTKLKAYSCTR